MKRLLAAAALSATLVSPAFAAIEIDESNFGPTYGSTVADVTVGKPLQFLNAVFGTAVHVIGLPFSIASDSVEQSRATLVEGPWSALQRCTGCTPAYDNYIQSQNLEQGQVRFVVDRPSEVIINSNDVVIVNTP